MSKLQKNILLGILFLGLLAALYPIYLETHKEEILKENLLSALLDGDEEQAYIRDRTKEFRHLICGNYKIIYWINLDKNQIEIWDVFDCRQELLKIKRTK